MKLVRGKEVRLDADSTRFWQMIASPAGNKATSTSTVEESWISKAEHERHLPQVSRRSGSTRSFISSIWQKAVPYLRPRDLMRMLLSSGRSSYSASVVYFRSSFTGHGRLPGFSNCSGAQVVTSVSEWD